MLRCIRFEPDALLGRVEAVPTANRYEGRNPSNKTSHRGLRGPCGAQQLSLP